MRTRNTKKNEENKEYKRNIGRKEMCEKKK